MMQFNRPGLMEFCRFMAYSWLLIIFGRLEQLVEGLHSDDTPQKLNLCNAIMIIIISKGSNTNNTISDI